ncbi:hypothetical protein [Faecalispora anaeroviscerum]|uniref:hypothetical protein n=1 Tax=Faecalispora anaeroviscerum TaxID=2991836 RepID=UPI0024B91F72|nr:hypothetical protein [Faecalispora anaeroviscerum]
MKYKSKPNWISRTILFLCMVALLISGMAKHYAPWDPARQRFELANVVLFFLFLIYFLYDWVQMRHYYQNQGADTSPQIRRRQILWYTAALVLYVGFLIWIVADFLGH